jgi:pimeloyl-ACP methyl ester carboxylesterase
MANKEMLDIYKVAKRIKTPFCIIHGREDAVVKEEDAEQLDSFIPTSTLIIIEGAGHTFGSSHPFFGDELPKHLNQVVEESLLFLKD